jgi:hypothetical protein
MARQDKSKHPAKGNPVRSIDGFSMKNVSETNMTKMGAKSGFPGTAIQGVNNNTAVNRIKASANQPVLILLKRCQAITVRHRAENT